MVKRLRHRPFTAVTRVRFPLGSLKRILKKRVLLCEFINKEAEQLITNQLINTYADVAQFIKINERSELVAGRTADYKSADRKYADVAQLAEQLICNQQVIGSSPIIGFVH